MKKQEPIKPCFMDLMAVELFQKEYGYMLLRKWSETEQVKLVTFRAFTFLKQEKIV